MRYNDYQSLKKAIHYVKSSLDFAFFKENDAVMENLKQALKLLESIEPRTSMMEDLKFMTGKQELFQKREEVLKLIISQCRERLDTVVKNQFEPTEYKIRLLGTSADSEFHENWVFVSRNMLKIKDEKNEYVFANISSEIEMIKRLFDDAAEAEFRNEKKKEFEALDYFGDQFKPKA